MNPQDLPTNLNSLNDDVNSVHRLEKHTFISPEVSSDIRGKIMAQAQVVHGSPLQESELQELTVTTGEKILRLLKLTNILLVIAGVIVAVAVISLGQHYLLDILKKISPAAYMVMAYLMSGGLILSAHFLTANQQLFTLIPGCLLFIGALALTNYVLNTKKENISLNAYIAFIVWSQVALMYHSPVVGFLAIGALFVAISTMNDFFESFSWLKYNDSEMPLRLAFSGLCVAIFGMVSWVGRDRFADLVVFQTSAQWLGLIVYFFSLLWLASRYGRHDDSYGFFTVSQIVCVASSLIVLYIGTMFEVQSCLMLGGWFTSLYLLEKYLELPWKGIGWAWAALFGAFIIYGFVLLIQANPQYFLI